MNLRYSVLYLKMWKDYFFKFMFNFFEDLFGSYKFIGFFVRMKQGKFK